jgi:hypothetical protein
MRTLLYSGCLLLMQSMLWETSLLDPEEGIRFRCARVVVSVCVWGGTSLIHPHTLTHAPTNSPSGMFQRPLLHRICIFLFLGVMAKELAAAGYQKRGAVIAVRVSVMWIDS